MRNNKISSFIFFQRDIIFEIDCFSDFRKRCKNCDSTGWVCEDHKNRPFEGMSDNGCECGGAGMPCNECNSKLED